MASTKGNERRWSFVRASEFFGGDGKPDTLDIRGMTAAAKGVSSKRQKFRMSVVKNGVTIYGSKPCPNPEHDSGHGLMGVHGASPPYSTPIPGNALGVVDVTNQGAGTSSSTAAAATPSNASTTTAAHSSSTPALKERERIFIEDPRAPCLTIEYGNDMYRMMPSIERFSAHTGVCQILGTKLIRGGKHHIQVGDILRFGSVGLLVTEIDTGRMGASDGSLSPADIAHLTQRLVCLDENQGDVDSGDDTDEANGNDQSQCDAGDSANRLSSTRSSQTALCYVCYDESEDDNPLIAPCKCSGDTKFIHVNCLKRWHTNGDKNEICAVLDESDARTCSICKAPYPSRVKIPATGAYVSLLPDRLDAPSIMLQVVTKHSSSTLNMSTRYQLSYKSLLQQVQGVHGNSSMLMESQRPLMIGRSSQCDLVLKYRTVSTIHAELHFSKGEWFVKDAGSSNGTLRYIYRPLTLQNNQMLHVKFGRTVLSIKPTKKLRLPSLFGLNMHHQSTPSSQKPDHPPSSNMTNSMILREGSDEGDQSLPSQSQHHHQSSSSSSMQSQSSSYMVGRMQGRALSNNATEGQSRRMYSADPAATPHRRQQEAPQQEPPRPPPTTTNTTAMAAAAAVIVEDMTEHMEGLDMGNHDAH